VNAERLGRARVEAFVEPRAVAGRHDDRAARMFGTDQALEAALDRRGAVVSAEIL